MERKFDSRGKEENPGKEIKVLNLFAYTGGATVACAERPGSCDTCGRFQRDGYMGERKCGSVPGLPMRRFAIWWMTA